MWGQTIQKSVNEQDTRGVKKSNPIGIHINIKRKTISLDKGGTNSLH